MVLWTFKAHVWVNDCAPWNLFFCVFLYPSWLWKETFVHIFLCCSPFSCRIYWFDDISVWYSYISSFLIHSVELCGSSLERLSPPWKQWQLSALKSVFAGDVTWLWCYLLLNVLAIFMVEEFYIYAVVHFFQSLMYESNTKVAGQRVREYQRQCSIPCNKMFSWCANT